MRTLAIAALLLGTISAESSFPAADFKQARALYYEGADGDKQAYERADQLFSKLYKQVGQTPSIEAYYGSLRLLEASHTWALWKKNSLSREGVRLMDQAVIAAPNDLDIRFVRAATTYQLPAFFHLRAQSEQDFKYLAERAEKAAASGLLEPRLAAASLYFHAEFLREESKKDAAVAFWKKAIQLAPASRAARDSRQELLKIGP